jgi:TRAP-type transport system small permease protein
MGNGATMSERHGDANATDDSVAATPPNTMDRFIDNIEFVAAIFIGIVAADVFITVVLRWFDTSIPDSYNFGQFLLGILIFWGIAATSYRGTHITVDVVWANVGPKWQRVIDVFATLVLLFVVSVQTYTLFDKTLSTYYSNLETIELRLPVWPFFAVAWLGDISAVMLIAVRTYRLIFQPASMVRLTEPAKAVE